MEPSSIGIVGGLGRMGKMMARFFVEAGYPVRIADRMAGPVDWQSIAQNDVVLLAVPIPEVEGVLREIGPHTIERGVVIDIASLKEAPVRAMLEHCRGEIIGTHPLFGPATASLEGQLVFLCPAKSTRWIVWLRAFLADLGAEVAEIDPLRHDRLMGTVQVLRHMLLFTFGRTLMQIDFDLASDLKLSGPLFSQLVGLLRRQIHQSPDLFANLAIHNPATEEVSDRFLEAAREICQSYGSQDRLRIVPLIEEVSSYLLSGVPTHWEPD